MGNWGGWVSSKHDQSIRGNSTRWASKCTLNPKLQATSVRRIPASGLWPSASESAHARSRKPMRACPEEARRTPQGFRASGAPRLGTPNLTSFASAPAATMGFASAFCHNPGVAFANAPAATMGFASAPATTMGLLTLHCYTIPNSELDVLPVSPQPIARIASPRPILSPF